MVKENKKSETKLLRYLRPVLTGLPITIMIITYLLTNGNLFGHTEIKLRSYTTLLVDGRVKNLIFTDDSSIAKHRICSLIDFIYDTDVVTTKCVREMIQKKDVIEVTSGELVFRKITKVKHNVLIANRIKHSDITALDSKLLDENLTKPNKNKLKDELYKVLRTTWKHIVTTLR